ncbi:hypothetical protein [Brucella intermedia]|uniref:hypothetical protein n=1 Tax=Brucella intermedia TaxID=94625 RepID=UPI00236042AC|nr:hypothetical protein [Brucella intermedia]
MKHAFLIAAILLSTSAAQAENADKVCKSWGDLAAKIMQLRQMETPMSRVIEIAADGEKDSISRQIVTQAYEQPAYSTKTHQARAVDSFRNRIELACFKSAK